MREGSCIGLRSSSIPDKTVLLIAGMGHAEPGVWAANDRARALSKLLGLNDRLSVALRGQHLSAIARGELRESRRIAEENFNLAHSGAQSDHRVGACHNLSQIYFVLGKLSDSKSYGEEGIQFFDPETFHISEWPGGNPGPQCLIYASAAASVLGEYQVSREYATRALEHNKLDPKPFSQITNFAILCIPAIVRRDRDAALELAFHVKEISLRYGYPVWSEWARMVDGWCEYEEGNISEGMMKMRSGFEAFAALELRASIGMAGLYEKQNRQDEAIEVLEGIYGWFSGRGETADTKDARKVLKDMDWQNATSTG